MVWLRRNPGEGGHDVGYDLNNLQFSVVIHHGGDFMNTEAEHTTYVGGKIDYFDYCEVDSFSMIDLEKMVADLGYRGGEKLYWLLADLLPQYDMKVALTHLKCQEDITDMILSLPIDRYIHVYIVGMNDSEETNGYQSEDDDSDDAVYVYKDDNSSDFETSLEEEIETFGGNEVTSSVVSSKQKRKTSAYRGGLPIAQVPSNSIVEDSNGSDDEMADSDVLDSSVDSDEDGTDARKFEEFRARKFEEFREEIELDNPSFKCGKVYASKKQFLMAVKTYAIANRKNVKFAKNNKERVNVVCQEGCPWLLRASRQSPSDPRDPTFQVKRFDDIHNCATEAKCRGLTAVWISQKYLRIFQSDSNISLPALEEMIYKDHTVIVNRMTLWRARELARIKLQGTDRQQYERLGRYKEELEKQNENNTAICMMDAGLFLRFYVCLEACKEGWIAGCRPIIGLDGCFLKGRYEGQLLTAIGIDANDCIFPIAYAVVEAENKEAWTWFLEALKKDLRITEENSHNYTIMSDKQKGLVPAIEAEFPISEHRFCVRHLYNNFKQEHRGKGLKDALWSAARATTPALFEKRMSVIRSMDEGAYHWLASKPPQHWSKSRFDTYPKCDMLVNNLCECFNRVILDARDKGVLTMLEIIRMVLMNRFFKRRALGEKNKNKHLCPRIQKKLDKLKPLSGQYWPQPTSVLRFQVRNPDDQFVVDLRERTCSCRRWDLNGIPCVHAISAINFIHEKPEDYVSHWYTVKMFSKSYALEIDCVNGQEMWPSSILAPLPPPMKQRKRGRPKKKRRLDPDEIRDMENAKKTRLSKKGVKMVCGRCGIADGHNIRKCKGIGCDPKPRPKKKNPARNANANDLAANNMQNNVQSFRMEQGMKEREDFREFDPDA